MKYKFDVITLYNRWRQDKYARPDSWTIIGIAKWWFGPGEYCYRLCFFGLEIKVWFKQKVK